MHRFPLHSKAVRISAHWNNSRYCAVLWMVVWSTINLPLRRVLWHGVMDVEEGYWSSSPGGESWAHYWVQSWWLWCWSEILLMTILFCNRTILMSAFVAWQSNYVMSYILLTQKMTHTNYWANIIPTWIPSLLKGLGNQIGLTINGFYCIKVTSNWPIYKFNFQPSNVHNS